MSDKPRVEVLPPAKKQPEVGDVEVLPIDEVRRG